MRKVIGVLLAIALVTGVALVANRPGPAGAQGGGTIEATVTYAGAPVVEKLKVNKDTEKCGTEATIRSEERRVGKEGRYRGKPDRQMKNRLDYSLDASFDWTMYRLSCGLY